MKKFIINAKRDGKQVTEEVEGTPETIAHIYTSEFGYTEVDIREVYGEDNNEPVVTKPTNGFNIPSDKEIMEMALLQNNTNGGNIQGNVPVPTGRPTQAPTFNNPAPKYKEYKVGDTKIRVNLSNGILEEYAWVKVDASEDIIGFKREGDDQITTSIEDYEVYKREWVKQSTDEEVT